MKEIQAIIRPVVLEELKEELSALNIRGLTIGQVMGCGSQKGWTEFYRGSEVYMNVLPKVRVSIVVPDARVDETINAIIKVARTGEVGDGKIFITNVERVVRIRTGEEGDDAL
ncbi:MAG: P-II family nitrogen regulator [Eubacteriaceae bacterium]|nr:P-II family nitrogen regulator [Eubacteriaceae bacterium]